MKSSPKIFRILILFTSILFLLSILYGSYSFFKELKSSEQMSVDIWIKAQERLLTFKPGDDIELTMQIIASNTEIPLIIKTQQGEVFVSNLSEDIKKDSLILQKKIESFSAQNPPIKTGTEDSKAVLYYGNTKVLDKLKVYPFYFFLLIAFLFILIMLFYSSIRKANENRLWVGMAKETAHQIGTPLSSLIGWTEIIKEHNPQLTEEIDKMSEDIDRLKSISNRFSHIGFLPQLKKTNIVEQTTHIVSYLKNRISRLVTIQTPSNKDNLYVKLDLESYSWAIENLVINAIDAMDGKGEISIRIEEKSNRVLVHICDNGKGIPKKIINKIFKSGFTTKKKGWGLGLTLVNRIIKDGHKGQIKVSSKEGEGTCFCLIFKSALV